jgi:hypothetical protein
MRQHSAEAVAKSIIEKCVPGVVAKFVQRQSHGEHDFDLFREDSKIGHMEVTRAMERGRQRDIAHINNLNVICPDLRYTWHIVPWPRPLIEKGEKVPRLPPIDKIGQDICSLLVKLENEGCLEFSADYYLRSATARRLVEELGIASGSCDSDSTGAGTVCMWYPRDDAAYQDPKYVLCAAQHEMEKPDNRKKLTGALAERHLFVMIDTMYYQPWYVINNCPPPNTSFQFDNDATHLWVAAWTPPDDWIVWSTTPNSSWRRDQVNLATAT